MFNNKKTMLILIIGIMMLIMAYYNQNIQQGSALNSETELSLLETGLETKNLSENSAVKDDVQIVVHLSGSVKNAGVYKLNKSDRLVDLIRAAGGLKKNADLKQINLAEKLYDGQKLIIPEVIEDAAQKNNYNDSGFKNSGEILINNYSASSDSSLININQADQSELEKLSGIGPAKASAILKYRNENSYFSQKKDLLKISGIGEKTLENIKDEIVLQ